MNPMTKTATSVLTALVLFLTMALPGFAAQFTDISGHWAQQAIENLSQRGILTGYPNGTFRPEGQITRAEFAAMLVKAMNLDNQFVPQGTRFVDVPTTFWGYRPIEIVAAKGYVSGYPGGYFRPYQNISKAEALSILVNAANVPLPSPEEADRILNATQDGALVPQWAQRAVAAAVQSGIFTGSGSAFARNGLYLEANQPATRAEVAMMTSNLQDYIAGRLRPSTTPTASQQQPGGSTMTGSATQQGDVIRGRVSVVPAMTVFSGIMTQTISSDRSQVGDPVTLTLDRPLLSAAGEIVIPQGSQVMGTITRIEPAGRGEKNATMDMDFNRVVTPEGRTFQVSAEVNTEEGTLVGGSTRGRVARVTGRTLGGAAIGGAAGALLGRITGGKERTNEGLLWGSIIGSGLGAASAVVSRGKEVVVQPGEVLELRLRQPLTVSNP